MLEYLLPALIIGFSMWIAWASFVDDPQTRYLIGPITPHELRSARISTFLVCSACIAYIFIFGSPFNNVLDEIAAVVAFVSTLIFHFNDTEKCEVRWGAVAIRENRWAQWNREHTEREQNKCKCCCCKCNNTNQQQPTEK